MKKEVVFAIFIGLSLGLVVTYGVYRARTSFLNGRLGSGSTQTNASPAPSAHNSLTLLSPEDESVQSDKGTQITGTTDPDALVVIFINTQSQVTTADKSGNFSIQADLTPGANVITVRTIDEDGNTAEEQRTVIMTSVSFEETATPSASLSASASAKITTKPKTATASATTK
jgi:hypothetical protein